MSIHRVVGKILVLAVVIGAATTSPSVARAAGNCNLDYGNWFAGWISGAAPAVEPEGATATLTYRAAASCQNGVHILPYTPAAYAGWVMVQGLNQGLEYAQAGFAFDGNSIGCIRHFAQFNFNYSGAPPTKWGSCVQDGEVHVPKVVYVTGTGGHVKMYIDSTLFLETTFCICSWAQPFQAFFSGESLDLNTDVPGLVATPLDWNHMSVQYVNTNAWHDVCGNITLYSVKTPIANR